MKKFEFRDSVKVDVAGVVVQLKIGSDILDKAIKFGEYIQEKAKGFDKLGYKKAIDVVCKECDNFIDEVTEKGAATQIFKNRNKDPFDRMQVVGFLIDEIKNEKSTLVNPVEKKYSPNRAQRRNKKKK